MRTVWPIGVFSSTASLSAMAGTSAATPVGLDARPDTQHPLLDPVVAGEKRFSDRGDGSAGSTSVR